MKKKEKKSFEILSELDTVKIKGGRREYDKAEEGTCGSVYACGSGNHGYCTNSGNCVAGCACPQK